MVKKRGLGKGLDSMIPERIEKKEQIVLESKIEQTNNLYETWININEIEPNRMQPRQAFREDTIAELADSIKQYGIIQPLILQKREKYYEIIAGERRWRAAIAAQLKTVPAIIRQYSKQESLELALIENIQREDLNAIEEALAYERLVKEFNLTQDEVAKKVSKNRSTITNSIRLLKLNLKVQQMLLDNKISSGHARALISISDSELQYSIAMKIFDQKLSVRETEKLIKQLLDNKGKQIEIKKENYSVIYKQLEEKIKSILGTKVMINQKSDNKGKIEIEYYSAEELDRLVELFEQLKE